MFAYVEWKWDFESPNKIKIISISYEHDLTKGKFNICKQKFMLGFGNFSPNHNFLREQIFYTRCKIGKNLANTNKLQIAVTESCNSTFDILQIKIYLCVNKSTMTSTIKNIFLNEIFKKKIDFYSSSNYYISESIELTKQLKITGFERYQSQNEYDISIWLGEVDVDV